MTAGEWAALVAGLALVLGTAASAVVTLVVPRGSVSRLRRLVSRGTRRVFLAVAGLRPTYEGRDRVLELLGPAMLLALLLTWLLVLLVGYSLLFVAAGHVTFADGLRASGSSMFTLGYVAARGTGATAVSFAAAASGIGVVALQISYLPTIYGAFNRRETLVTLLESRAGSPAWGPELLWRHQGVQIVDSLPALYAEWEAWAADVAETHTTYPVLVHFRSPHPYRSWVVALLAVMDSAALYLALAPSRAPSEARLCLRMGFVALREIARTLGLAFDPDPMPDAPADLTFEEFAQGVALVAGAGFPVERSAAQAWPDFRGWRVNYESVVYALADVTVAPAALWSGPRRHVPGPVVAPVRPVDRRPGLPQGAP